MHLPAPPSDAVRGVPSGTTAAFLAAEVTVDLPSGRVWIRPRAPREDEGAGDDPFPSSHGHVVVLTAHNPGGVARDAARNATAQQRLHARLAHDRIAWWPAVGGDPQGRWREPSVAVPDLPLDRAVALAREHGQAAFFVWAPGRLLVVWTPAAGPVTADDRPAAARLDA